MNKLSRILLPILVGGFLVACQALGLPEPQTPQQAVYAAKVTFAGTLVLANEYKELPPCPTVLICSDEGAVTKLRLAGNAAKTTLDAAENTVRDPNFKGSKTDAAVVAATQAVSAFAQITQQVRSAQ